MLKSVTPGFHDDRFAGVRSGSLSGRTILEDETGHRVIHCVGLRRAANRPQISLIHLCPGVQRDETTFR